MTSKLSTIVGSETSAKASSNVTDENGVKKLSGRKTTYVVTSTPTDETLPTMISPDEDQ
jgi:hypothetical protein